MWACFLLTPEIDATCPLHKAEYGTPAVTLQTSYTHIMYILKVGVDYTLSTQALTHYLLIMSSSLIQAYPTSSRFSHALKVLPRSQGSPMLSRFSHALKVLPRPQGSPTLSRFSHALKVLPRSQGSSMLSMFSHARRFSHWPIIKAEIYAITC